MALIDKVRVIKLLLFALFMMVSMVTPAQSQVDWSIKAGIGMANIIGDNMGSPKVKLAYKLGIGLECPFDKIWSLQTGVSFVSKGTNHTIVETDGISAQAKVNASYLEFPVMVAARFAMDRNTHILVGGSGLNLVNCSWIKYLHYAAGYRFYLHGRSLWRMGDWWQNQGFRV